MSDASWSELTTRMQAIYDSGEETPDACSDLSEPGECVRFFPETVYAETRQWIMDACTLAHNGRFTTTAASLERIVEAYTTLRISRALPDFELHLFAKPEYDDRTDPRDGVLRRDEQGKVVGIDRIEGPFDGMTWYDPLDTRARFQAFLLELLAETHLARELESTAPVQQEAPDQEKEFWSVEDLARFKGVQADSIRKEVSGIRRREGRDPIWVRRFPGMERDFEVNWFTYRSLLKRGRPARSLRVAGGIEQSKPVMSECASSSTGNVKT